jgi:hypothetical protein
MAVKENNKPDFGKMASSFKAKFYTPHSAFDVNIARIIILSTVLYKLLSRDFSFFGTVPEEVFSFYPIYIYSPTNYIEFMGIPGLMDLATFHWIHWLLPFPNVSTFIIIQSLTMLSLALCIIFGRGYKNCFIISSYIGVMYLWGFLFRTGQEIDAMFLGMGAMLVYIFSNHSEVPIYKLKTLLKEVDTKEAGWTFSAILMIFVIYYFTSGINKISDLTFLGWFQYDVISTYEYMRDLSSVGYTIYIPSFFSVLDGQYWLNFGAPFVYIVHLTAPHMFFDRRQVFKYFIIYGSFHLLTIAVSIIFFANFLFWLVFVPYKKIILKLMK